MMFFGVFLGYKNSALGINLMINLMLPLSNRCLKQLFHDFRNLVAFQSELEFMSNKNRNSCKAKSILLQTRSMSFCFQI